MPAQADTRTQTSHVQVKVNGAPLADTVAKSIVEVSVDQDLVLPEAFAIRFRDVDSVPNQDAILGITDSETLSIGKEVTISLGRENAPEPALTAEVTSLELEMQADGLPMLTVGGYSKAHRMNRLRQTKVYQNSTGASAVSTVARRSGLRANVASGGAVYTHLVQDNQTDLEFVRDLARREGKEVHVNGSTLAYRESAAQGATVELAFGIGLRHFRVRAAASSQVNTVEVRGWDPQAKRAVVGTATTPVQITPKLGAKTGAQSASAFGTGKYVLTDYAARKQTEAQARAQSILDEIAGEFMTLELSCLGDPALKPGAAVKVTGVGTKFSGTYYVSAATHRFTPDLGYLTYVTVSGRRPSTLMALMSTPRAAGPGSPDASRPGSFHAGVVVGLVTNNKDEEMGGRVKVKLPWLDEQFESTWARIATPMAGNGRGFFWLPEVDDEVLVAFEHGDLNHPYVIGYLWNGRDKPPGTAATSVGSDGKVNKRVIKSRTGHLITLDDTQAAENITIVDKTGKNTIKLESPTNKLTVSVDGDMVFEALKGNIQVKSKTMALEALQGLTIKGLTVNATATQGLTLKGTTSEFEGTAQVKVKGASAEVQAQARLSLNGGAMTEVKGGILRLN